MRRMVRQLWKAEEGQSLVIIVLALVALMGMTAMVIDGSYAYAQHRRMQTAADLAAMAGARALGMGLSASEIEQEIAYYATSNGADSYSFEFIDENGQPVDSIEEARGVRVTAQKSFNTFLANVVGINQMNVSAQSAASFFGASEANNLLPIAVRECPTSGDDEEHQGQSNQQEDEDDEDHDQNNEQDDEDHDEDNHQEDEDNHDEDNHQEDEDNHDEDNHQEDQDNHDEDNHQEDEDNHDEDNHQEDQDNHDEENHDEDEDHHDEDNHHEDEDNHDEDNQHDEDNHQEDQDNHDEDNHQEDQDNHDEDNHQEDEDNHDEDNHDQDNHQEDEDNHDEDNHQEDQDNHDEENHEENEDEHEDSESNPSCVVPELGAEVTYELWDDDPEAPGAFGWLDWNGGSRSAMELANNIANPSNSGTWEIGDAVPASPGVQVSSQVRNALNQWIGQEVTLVLYQEVVGQGANTQYIISGFGRFVITDINMQGDDKWIRGYFTGKVIPGSSSSGVDFGLRVVKLTD